MNNKGKSGKTVKKSPRPSHSGRPVSVKKTSSPQKPGTSGGNVRKKKRIHKKKPLNILRHLVLAVIIAVVVLAVCALGYGFFEMRMEEQNGYGSQQEAEFLFQTSDSD